MFQLTSGFKQRSDQNTNSAAPKSLTGPDMKKYPEHFLHWEPI